MLSAAGLENETTLEAAMYRGKMYIYIALAANDPRDSRRIPQPEK